MLFSEAGDLGISFVYMCVGKGLNQWQNTGEKTQIG